MNEPSDLNDLSDLKVPGDLTAPAKVETSSVPSDVDAPVVPKRNPEENLSGQQRRFLRGLAHHLNALVAVGKDGVTQGVLGATQEALVEHELIKVRVHEGAPITRKQAAPTLAEGSGAHLVGQLGRIVILYRRRDRKPEIRLPKRV